MNITVYCGAHSGKNYDYRQCAIQVGEWIAKNNNRLVYGAGRKGLMGLVANTVLDAGGEVTGVMPRFLEKIELAHSDLTELIHVENMSERKRKMFELGDVFIALPGGAGTLEEIVEVISWSRLGQNDKPCIFFNENNFYDDIEAFYEKMTVDEFITREAKEKILFTTSFEEIDEFIKNYTPPSLVEPERD
ncbi:MAG: TIGR00730 family Rossman fold protein [Eubacteriales bacterium]|nr:TIGR00730 family Rossman fold protein [Eubacteriales bacterium]MDY3332312.1 TIGR00730 family Rossman fold protein [Gallibacter sp.]